MPSKIRMERIADRFRQELTLLLQREINDPRLEGVYVNHVKVDRELAYADIYYSALEGRERMEEIQEGFEHASGHLRKRLSEEIELRSFPRLRFHWDAHSETVAHLEELFAEMKREDEARGGSAESAEGVTDNDAFELEEDEGTGA